MLAQKSWRFALEIALSRDASTFTHALTSEVDRVSYGAQQMFQGLAGLMVLAAYIVVAWLLSSVTTAAVVLCGIILIFGLKNKI
jgi:hypothetical protein